LAPLGRWFKSTMTAIPSTNGSSHCASTSASNYRVYAQQAASGHLASLASAAVAAATAEVPPKWTAALCTRRWARTSTPPP